MTKRIPATMSERTSATMPKRRTLADQLEEIHLILTPNEDYRRYLSTTSNKEAIEGSIFMDRAQAAQMIRDQALKMGNVELGTAKLKAIIRALGVVKRRCGLQAS
jgi:ethanolamine utilization microcompartment shell protein EutS